MNNLFVFLVILSILILIHELGHFLVAKFLGIRVEEFAFGLPFTKPLFKYKWGETQLSFYPLLLGGFVRLYGEESEPEKEKKRSFWHRPGGQRLLVISAGVVMNIILAGVAFVLLYRHLGIPTKRVDKVTVEQVVAGSEAEKAGIRAGDRLIAVEGKIVNGVSDYSRLVKSWAGLKTHVTVERGDSLMLFEGLYEQSKTNFVVEMIPKKNPGANEGATGVAINSYPYIESIQCSISSIQCAVKILKVGGETTKLWVGRVFEGLREMGRGIASGKAPKDVAGPLGVYQITGVVAEGGFWPLLELLAILSVNLAVFNFLPIPALDGGRALFVLLELLFRRRIPSSVEQKINSWGFAALLAVVVLASFQDAIRLGWLK